MTRCLPLALILLLLPQHAGAADPAASPDAGLARDLVKRGQIMPLAEVLQRLQRVHPGQVVGVELEYEDEVLVYEVDLITAEGRLIEVDMNAATGKIIDLDEADED